MKKKIIVISILISVILLISISYIGFSLIESNIEDREESGQRLNPDETYDGVLNEVHLIISYDDETDSFKGQVDNPTEKKLYDVRVEVHMYRGSTTRELGPTTPKNLDPGESMEIELSAEGWNFDSWTAHAETGSSEDHEGEEPGEPNHDKILIDHAQQDRTV
jgi:hypothetical protein